MQLPNLLPKWISNRAADPEGAAPKGLVTKIGVVLLAVLMAVVILLAPDDEAVDGAAPVAAPLPPPAGPAAVAKGEQVIDDAEGQRAREQSRQARRKREAADGARRLEEEWQRQQQDMQDAAAAAAPPGGGAAGSEQELTPEQQLYQSIRLEKIQLQHSSLRAAPVALSFRAAAVEAPQTPPPVELTPPPAQPTMAPPSPIPPQPTPTTTAERALAESDVVAARARPRDPRGWERIDGGQWIEAVLVTQIKGDNPGPAIARVATPFWSRDRQRILIPRGARFIGRAQAVSSWEQARLSVTFDRLIFDGYNLRLPFAGLSQAGEAGLKDKVNRHYLATFGAAGAVGVISGLTLRNTQSYGFGQPAGQAARMEAGRSLGESASSIMSQYLNRLPTITIRAGQRIRIYFTSDLLVPRRPS